ncbi:hypothetical protein D3C77_420940 [compost metagenome]
MRVDAEIHFHPAAHLRFTQSAFQVRIEEVQFVAAGTDCMSNAFYAVTCTHQVIEGRRRNAPGQVRQRLPQSLAIVLNRERDTGQQRLCLLHGGFGQQQAVVAEDEGRIRLVGCRIIRFRAWSAGAAHRQVLAHALRQLPFVQRSHRVELGKIHRAPWSAATGQAWRQRGDHTANIAGIGAGIGGQQQVQVGFEQGVQFRPAEGVIGLLRIMQDGGQLRQLAGSEWVGLALWSAGDGIEGIEQKGPHPQVRGQAGGVFGVCRQGVILRRTLRFSASGRCARGDAGVGAEDECRTVQRRSPGR